MIQWFRASSEFERQAAGTCSSRQRPVGSGSAIRWLGAPVTIGAVAAALAGCLVSVGPPRSGDQELLTTKKAAVVLSRFVAIADGRPIEFLDGSGSPAISLHVANIDTGDQFREVRAPTPEAKKDGWVYLVLAPGRYYLRVRLDGIVSGRYFVRVPAAGTVVYAGSLPVTCNSAKRTSQSFLCRLDGTVADESESAARIARASFAQYGPLVTTLMQGPR